jgi:hypothetical protein
MPQKALAAVEHTDDASGLAIRQLGQRTASIRVHRHAVPRDGVPVWIDLRMA